MKKLILILTLASCSTREATKINFVKSKPETFCSLSEYQFNVDNTGYDIMDENGKLIGRLNYGDNPSLDSLIDFDNK